MTRLLGWCLALVTCWQTISAGAGEEALPLPEWRAHDGRGLGQDEVRIFPFAGSLLPKTREANAAGEANPKGAGSQTPEIDALTDVDAGFLHVCEQLPAGTFLLDPRGLLPQNAATALRQSLWQQAERARIAVHVMLLPGRHKLPDAVDLSRITSGGLMRGLSCLVVYPMGQPARVRLFLSKEITQTVPSEALQELAQHCIRKAGDSADDVGQLTPNFISELLLRLTWLEREHPVVFADSGMSGTPVQSHAEDAGAASKESTWGDGLRQLWQKERTLIHWSGGGLLALLGLIWLLRTLWRRMIARRRSRVWMLPPVKTRPRLGGKHCGGGGASMRY